MSSYLTSQQIEQLLAGINSRRVQHRDGNSHLEAYDVRAHLTRIFGFGRWSADLLEKERLFEEIGPKASDPSKTVVSVGYSATVRLAICAPDGTVLCTFTEAATGDATNFPITKRADAHDFAIKTAESQAFKRTAINLGDQFGLSLYRKGSLEPLVLRTLVGQATPQKPDGEQKPDAPAAVDADTPEIVPESEQTPEPPTETTERPAVTPPAAEEPVEDRQERADAIRQQLLDLPASMGRQERIRAIAALKIAAGKGRLLQVQVGDVNGEFVVSLNELLDVALRAPAAA